jgi:hypothetical protein
MAILENKDPTEARLDPDTGSVMSQAAVQLDEERSQDTGESKSPFEDGEIVSFLNESNRLSKTYQQMVAFEKWRTAQSAYRSEHSDGSKYFKDQYKNRAKYFKPKTRARCARTSQRRPRRCSPAGM